MIILTYLRSIIFETWLITTIIVMGAIGFPVAAVSRSASWWWCRTWFRLMRRSVRLICGVHVEIRGDIPTTPVVVASKHQSFLDVIALVDVLPNGRFVMKAELRKLPIFGWYAARCGMVFVERGKGGAAVLSMTTGLKESGVDDRQIVIFPQGTRVKPGADVPYKIGVHRLYEAFERPCVPVALNTGHFWGRKALLKTPGTAVVEFLPEIPAGQDGERFMERLESDIEAASNRLEAEISAQR